MARSEVPGGGRWRVGEVGDADFQAGVLQSPLPVLVDFRIADCPPCRLLEPILEKLAADYDGALRIVSLDAEANPIQVRRFEVTSVPTLILFIGGAERRRFVGVLPRPLLELWLHRAL